MESPYSGHNVTGAGLSYSPYSSASSISTTMLRSLEFDSRNSVTSHFDAETLSSCSENSSTVATTSSNSSLDYNNYLNQLGASPFCLQDSPLINSDEASFLGYVNDNQQLRHALHDLESALMDADDDDDEVIVLEPFLGETMQSGQTSTSWNGEAHRAELPHGYQFGSSNNELHIDKFSGAREDFDFAPGSPSSTLKQLLIMCAEALSENNVAEFEKLVEHARAAVSITGEPIQRLGAYMVEGLIARKGSSGTNLYRALKWKEPDSKDLLSYMRTLYNVCPYWKFSYMAANGAIAEACKNEDRIHIIDFQIAQGMQWITLLQALAARPAHVRITGIDDPVSRYARGDGLAALGKRFAAISKKFNIPVEFHAVPVLALDVTRDMLDIRPGEALVVNFPLQLHTTPDESVDVSNPRDGLLRMVKSLCPKVVTLVEQESNTNTAAFLPRFVETLNFYSALFESIDVTTPRDEKERISIEQHCLARDIVNVIACEGKERVERHELFGKWRLRFMMAGFKQLPLSSYVNSVIKGLLKCYSEHFRLVEKDGAMLLGWKNRNLISASAWH